MSDAFSIRRVIMTRALARNWLLKQANPEFRFRVFNPGGKDYTSLLRSFRDGRFKLANVQPIPDLGVKDGFECFFVWSSNKDALQTLDKWFRTKGLETTWIW